MSIESDIIDLKRRISALELLSPTLATKSDVARVNADFVKHKASGDHDHRYASKNELARVRIQLNNITSSCLFDGGAGIVIDSPDGTAYKIEVADGGMLEISQYEESVI